MALGTKCLKVGNFYCFWACSSHRTFGIFLHFCPRNHNSLVSATTLALPASEATARRERKHCLLVKIRGSSIVSRLKSAIVSWVIARAEFLSTARVGHKFYRQESIPSNELCIAGTWWTCRFLSQQQIWSSRNFYICMMIWAYVLLPRAHMKQLFYTWKESFKRVFWKNKRLQKSQIDKQWHWCLTLKDTWSSTCINIAFLTFLIRQIRDVSPPIFIMCIYRCFWLCWFSFWLSTLVWSRKWLVRGIYLFWGK